MITKVKKENNNVCHLQCWATLSCIYLDDKLPDVRVLGLMFNILLGIETGHENVFQSQSFMLFVNKLNLTQQKQTSLTKYISTLSIALLQSVF